MKNCSPIYTILATMAVAAMAIGAEPVRSNKKVELSKADAGKSGYEFVRQSAHAPLPGHRILVIDSDGLNAGLTTKVAVAIATAKARKRTG